MLWSEKDSLNLKRLADAVEEIAGKKTFVPNKEKTEIKLVENEENEDDMKEREAAENKVEEILKANEGNHLWEETNLEEIGDELVD